MAKNKMKFLIFVQKFYKKEEECYQPDSEFAKIRTLAMKNI